MSDGQLFPCVEGVELPVSQEGRADVLNPPRLRVVDRRQVVMMPRCLDELLAQDHQARVIWAVVGRLDISRFLSGIAARGQAPGRAATDPRVLITLWLNATTDGVGSAREVAGRCKTDDVYRWVCGGLSINHHTLSDFRVNHGAALDDLFTQVIAQLVARDLISVYRISQDGTRVRAMAGTASFRGEERLKELLAEAKKHVEELKKQLDAPQSASLSARKKAAMKRAARERQQRLEEALEQIPLLNAVAEKPKNRAKTARARKSGKKVRASTTDPQARKMRMGDGGTRPAYNVQLAMDTQSRAIVGVDITNIGSDNAQSLSMRQQVEQRTGGKVAQHLADGGFLNLDHIDQSESDGVAMYVPPPKRPDGTDPCTPRAKDSPETALWRARMAEEASKQIYGQRASTIETANADLKTHRGLEHILVRGLSKVKSVVILAAMSYNILHFGKSLLS